MTEDHATIYSTRSGPMLALETDQFVGQAIVVYGEYCEAEAQVLRQLVAPGMNVIEVGANMGSHSVALARACAPGAFFAFEPQPRLFQILCANLALNQIANALAYPDACGETEGTAMIPAIDYRHAANFGAVSIGDAGQPGIAVRVRTIDAIGLAQCGLIKIDVEGHEAQVLRGARETILRCRPVLYVENDRAEHQQELIALIAGLGYRLHWHTPPLFNPGNFRGVAENIFREYVSVNMICVPLEAALHIEGSPPIDPANWTCPVPMR